MGHITTALLTATTVIGLPASALAQASDGAGGDAGLGLGGPALVAAAVVAWSCIWSIVAFQFRRQRQLRGRLDELEGQIDQLGKNRED